MPRAADYLPGVAVAARCGVTALRRVGKSRVAVRCPWCGGERWLMPEALFGWAKSKRVPRCEDVYAANKGTHCRLPHDEPTEGSCHG